ncbi:virulence factor TspB C-terminal domain-related protein [Pseudomonas sp.]|uniref:virulence factor TspB C-terminal domain-related protein n=1 Tax=Pseudomonas sp. TaxID=306 RepID=UPI00257EE373|nr:virulence factor TspB C-terminal domain-related protein [Pseudomonas sp.]
MKVLHFFTHSLVALVFLGFGQSVFAEDYYWYHTYNGQKYPSPNAACLGWLGSSSSLRFYSLTKLSDSSFYCQLQRISDGALGGYGKNMVRRGDSCPPDTTLNSDTGECELPPPDHCEGLAGTSFPFNKSGTAGDGYVSLSAGGKFGGAEQSACYSGCVANTADQKCTTRVTGAYFCQGTGYYTGAECGSGGVSEVEESPVPDYPEPETFLEDKPCIPVANPDGSTTCTSEKSVEKEGQHCGTFNGERICTDSQPSKNKVDIKTDTEVKTNPDGSKTTTQTDTATVTKCNGTSCTTTTTTTKTTTNTDSAGNNTGTTGTCKGPDCPDKNGNPDGDGDGFGDCIGGECEESSGVGGEGCDVPLACEGDPIQCAILRKNKEQQCFAEEQADFEGQKENIEQLVQGEKFDLDEGEGDIDVPPFINQGTRFLPSSCPADETMSLHLAGGRNFGLSYEPLCRAATDLSGLFVAVATILAALYVGRAVGGK